LRRTCPAHPGRLSLLAALLEPIGRLFAAEHGPRVDRSVDRIADGVIVDAVAEPGGLRRGCYVTGHCRL
jgi:hypothetical protein